MTKRLGVASLGVAGLAYIFDPLSVMVGFILLVGGCTAWQIKESQMDEKEDN